MSSKQPYNESVIDIADGPRDVLDEPNYDEGNETNARIPRVSRDSRNNETATTYDNSTSSSPDGQLFSTNYVDQLVESFWTKIDQKIDDAVSQQQAAHKIQEQTLQNDKQAKEKEKASAVGKYTEYYNFSYSFIYMFEFLLRICTLFKTKVFAKARTAVAFISSIQWRENFAKCLFHRRAHFIVFLLTVIDVTLVSLIILRDFDFVDEENNVAAFQTFQIICLSIMSCFLLEILLKIVCVGKAIFSDSLEVFDCILVTFYFIAELAATKAFRNIDGTYSKYIHIAASLRLWRIVIILSDAFLTKDEAEETG
ncbi:uncharacterized protein LOC116302532 [Actinia tenebrosa]|uniref:Uncharacterized protein LOC116302532 n=1 Tax=Actinia tenebrosa TaxID=6105 RepID=A0A6P8IMW9_ACTTE|nr:uncharacterized protein LOC116302532 [Actinia tenebrosa]